MFRINHFHKRTTQCNQRNAMIIRRNHWEKPGLKCLLRLRGRTAQSNQDSKGNPLKSMRRNHWEEASNQKIDSTEEHDEKYIEEPILKWEILLRAWSGTTERNQDSKGKWKESVYSRKDGAEVPLLSSCEIKQTSVILQSHDLGKAIFLSAGCHSPALPTYCFLVLCVDVSRSIS